ncbi:RpiB/LacA/LacB family sugar-phosphate isomerase, partial [bacterium]|nr:RpiB/LacA/LacB family sugar-phosphate isomerase [bacterium]
MNPLKQKDIYIASDHAGFELKKAIIKHFDLNFVDLGPESSDSVDYPDYAHKVCSKVALASKDSGMDSIGILICGSG